MQESLFLGLLFWRYVNLTLYGSLSTQPLSGSIYGTTKVGALVTTYHQSNDSENRVSCVNITGQEAALFS